MDARALNLLHDARNTDVNPVRNGVDFHFAPDHVLIDEHGMFMRGDDSFAQILPQFFFFVHNLHCASAQDVARPDNQRIIELLRLFHGFFHGLDEATLRPRNTQLSHERVKTFAVFRQINPFIRRADNANTAFGHRRRQIDRRLPAELTDDALRFLLFDDFHHVFFRQRLEIQRVGRIEVRGNGFRIVVNDDGFLAGFAQRPGRVDGAVIEFNPLPDPNRTAAEDDDAPLTLRAHFVLLAVRRIVVRCLRFKFRRARVDHFVIGMNPQFLFESRDFLHIFRQEMRNRRVGHLDTLRRAQRFLREPFLTKAFLNLNNIFDFVKEKPINLRDAMNFLRIDAAPQRFGDNKKALVVNAVQEAADVIE